MYLSTGVPNRSTHQLSISTYYFPPPRGNDLTGALPPLLLPLLLLPPLELPVLVLPLLLEPLLLLLKLREGDPLLFREEPLEGL